MRQQPVRKQKRLGVLHMSCARHRDAEILFGLFSDSAFQQIDGSSNFFGGFFHVHTKFSRNHFIAAASGVQFRAKRSKLFDQCRFSKMMNVLRRR